MNIGRNELSASSRLDRIRLRHVTCFLEIIGGGSARAAARALNVTESAVSKTVRELESELGLRLFERSKAGMSLTEGGQRFARYAKSAVDALRLGIDSADPAGSQPVTLKVGAMPVFAAMVLPPAVNALLKEMPQMVLEVASGGKEQLLDQLRKGELAFVLGRMPPPDDLTGLAFEPLFFDKYIFTVRPGHPLSELKSPRFADIAKYPLVMPSRSTVTWQELQRAFAAEGAAPSLARIETIYLQFSRNYVLGSDAVWACSSLSSAHDLAAKLLVQLPLDSQLLQAPLGIISRPQASLDVVADAFLRCIRQSVRSFITASDDRQT